MALKWADSSLSAYIKFSPKDAQSDVRRGKADGKRNYPPIDADTFCAYEMTLIATGNGALTKFDRHREEELTRLKQEMARKEHDRDEGYKAKKDGLEKDKDATLTNLRATHGPVSALYSGLSEKHAEKKSVLQQIELELNRPLRVHFVRTYLIFLALLSLAEVPINKLAFEFFFEEAPVIALGIALMVGILFISLAHVCGIWLRQAGHYRSTTSRVLTYLATVVVIIVVASLIYFIAALRQQFIDFIESEQQFSLTEFLRSGGLGEVASKVGRIQLGTASLTLLFINVIIFGFGMILSFLRHDPHPDYEKAVREREVYERQLQRVKVQFEKKSSDIQSQFDGKISYLDKAIDQLEAEIADIGNRIESIENSGTEAVKLVQQVIEQRVLAYQAGNIETRPDGHHPPYFGRTSGQQLANAIHLP